VTYDFDTPQARSDPYTGVMSPIFFRVTGKQEIKTWAGENF